MDSLIMDTEAGEVVDVFDLPDQVVLAELAHGDQLTFTAWHTFSPDAAEQLGEKLIAAAAKARK